MKTFRQSQNIGKAKYVISFHDGIKKHADGSPFFDIHTASNKKQHSKFIKELIGNGFVEQ